MNKIKIRVMNRTLIEYLKKQGFSVMKIDNKALGNKLEENVYNAVCRDYRRFLFLEWSVDVNYPSVKVFVCDNFSTENTRKFIGYPNVMKLDDFKKGLKKCYIEHYGWIRWILIPVVKPFFNFLRVKETPLRAY